jgi:hypothetical protein
LWVGHHIYSSALPFWLGGAVTLTDDDYDINVNALVVAFKKQTAECLVSKDADRLREAKNILATHLMMDQGNTEVLLDLARVDALLGNYSTAMSWLKKAANAGFNDAARLASEVDLKSLHGQLDWDSTLAAVRSNKAPAKKAEAFPEGNFKFKFGSPDATEEKNKGSSARAAPQKAQKEEEPKPAKPASGGGFLFSLPGSQPEKPKEAEKPAPKPSGFLFSLPGASQPAAEPKKKEEKQEEPEKDPMEADKAKYATQLDVLHSMGFLDDALLIGFLEKFKGNVDDVLTELLG